MTIMDEGGITSHANFFLAFFYERKNPADHYKSPEGLLQSTRVFYRLFEEL